MDKTTGAFRLKRYQYRYDFYVKKSKTVLEIDGPHHYKQVSNWNTPLHNQIRDEYKRRKARRKGIAVIRLHQEDIWYDRTDWKAVLARVFSTTCQ
jgi:very-short-patch-repair endonuclease